MKVKTEAEIAEYLAPIGESLGVEIVETKWDRRTNSLNIFIDAPGGVDLLLLEKFHRAVDGPLDELDPTFGAAYTLNCSSAGLDRPFKSDRDYARHLGEKIELHLYAPIDGKKYYAGELLSFDGESVTLSAGTGEKTFPRDKISKACLYIEV